MITVDNAVYGLNNVIEELEHVLAQLAVYTLNYGTSAHFTLDADELRAKISIASMQLSALSDDFDEVVINEDKLARSQTMAEFFPLEASTPKHMKGKKKHGKNRT
jgi:hypothetical protein